MLLMISISKRTKNLLFDLDGTLLDSQVGILRCVNYALEQVGADRRDPSDLLPMIGPPLHLGFLKFLPDNSLVDAAVIHYRERYQKTGIFECELFPAIKDVLSLLDSRGYRLFLVTAKPMPYAEQLIAHFSLNDRIGGVYAPRFGEERDGKSHLIEQCLEREKLERSESVMVGDRDRDVLAAQATGVASIGALWGYGSPGELADCEPNHLASKPEELVDIFTA
jgi:phosphoglycolate phosphatase